MDPENNSPAYDYLLCVGPGRSASTLLFELLRRHPNVSFPEIKEGYYYQRPDDYRRFRDALPKGSVLADISNEAYSDDKLKPGCSLLRARNQRILIVVLIRPHLSRAKSVLAFELSRGQSVRQRGMDRLIADVVERRLQARHLTGILDQGVDTLLVDFDLMTQTPEVALDCITDLCALPRATERNLENPVNESVVARSYLLSFLGKSVALSLRAMGLRSLLQWIKDQSLVHKVFFRASAGGANTQEIPRELLDILETEEAACVRVLNERTATVIPGLRWAGPSPAPAPPVSCQKTTCS